MISGLSFATGGVDKDGDEVELEVALFEGGYGLDIFKEIARELEKAHPEVVVNVWGNPRVMEQLRPRFIAGDPPDVVYIPQQNDALQFMYEGMLYPVNELYESKSFDQNKKVWDTFTSSIQEVADEFKFEGKHYLLPLSYSIRGIFYDAVLFKRNGWSIPSYWDEFLALSDKIKASGIAPWTYQGIYPGYMAGIIRPLIYKSGGKQAIFDIDNLKPGAWKNPDVIKALKLIQDYMAHPGYVLSGTEGLSHTESQMEWLRHSAAMLPCGTWLENEMKDVTPDDFEMNLAPIPGIRGGKGNVTGVEVSTDFSFVIPRDAKNPKWGIEYMRMMYSSKMSKRFVELVGESPPIIGATEGVEISKPFANAIAVAEKAEVAIVVRFSQWYPTLAKVFNEDIGEFLWGRISVEDYTDKLEAEAQRIAKDESIKKFTRK
jgi:N-acetylglucosamine transport system substrate-binding protein